MVKIVTAICLASLTVIVLLSVHSTPIASQQSQSQPLNTVILDVRRAESAGAQPEELGRLVNQLNSVIDLEGQLQNLSPQEADKRSQILNEINNTLANVDTEANQIEITASQRTFTNHLVAYGLGGVGTLMATIASYCALSLWRKYRAKRFLDLKIVPR